MKNFFWCLLLFGSWGSSWAVGDSLFEMPARPEQAKIHLMTVGLGEDVYTRFGHSIVRVEDADTGRVQLLNWGLFDFDAPNFYYDFFRGQLIYMMGASDLGRTIHLYQQREQRKVWQQELRLTPEQKSKFLHMIHENGREENIRYPYQYFYNNCATVIRDLLDKVFDGQLEKHFKARIVDKTYRHYVYTNLNKPPPVAMFLDIVMNSRLDFFLSEWHEMFLPDRISLYFSQFPSRVTDEEGKYLPLLSEPVTLVENGDYPPSSFDAYMIMMLVTLTPLFWLGLLLGPGFKHIGVHAKDQILRVRLALRGIGFLGLLYFTCSFVLGTIMLVSWIFSEHLDLHHNANLFLFWPTDFLLLPLCGILFFKGQVARWFVWGPRLRWYLYLHLGAALIYTLAFLFGLSEQNVTRVTQFVLPVHILILAILAKLAFFGPDKAGEDFDEDPEAEFA